MSCVPESSSRDVWAFTPIRELLDTVRECGMCPLDDACEAPDEKAAAGDKDCAMCVRGWDALNELEARLA